VRPIWKARDDADFGAQGHAEHRAESRSRVHARAIGSAAAVARIVAAPGRVGLRTSASSWRNPVRLAPAHPSNPQRLEHWVPRLPNNLLDPGFSNPLAQQQRVDALFQARLRAREMTPIPTQLAQVPEIGAAGK